MSVFMALVDDTDARSPKEPADEAAMASASDGEGDGDGIKRRGRASRMAVERGAGDASICVAAGVSDRIGGPFWDGGGEGPARSFFDGGAGGNPSCPRPRQVSACRDKVSGLRPASGQS